MKIILNKTYDGLGNEGDIVNVKNGYARNYLIPLGIAKNATENNIAAIKKEIEIRQKQDAKNRENLAALIKQLDKLSLKFELKAGEDDKLFGSVTSQMISDEIEKEGYSIDKKEIILEEPIKNVGTHKVIIDLGYDHKPEIKIKVSAANK